MDDKPLKLDNEFPSLTLSGEVLSLRSKRTKRYCSKFLTLGGLRSTLSDDNVYRLTSGRLSPHLCFESEILLPSAISRISRVEPHLVADLPQTKATSTPNSATRPNLFNVMAVSRALQNIVSTEGDR